MVGTGDSPVRPEPTLRERSEPKGRSPAAPFRSIATHKKRTPSNHAEPVIPCCVEPSVPTTGPTTNDELWMEEALRSAQRALEAGEVPVGAVVVCQGRIVGRGWNRNIGDSDPTAHAEIMALRDAGATVGNHRLADCDLFATIEPCPMCAGALVHSRINRLVYGADDSKAGAVRSVMQVLNHPQLNHKVQVRGGVLAGRCAELMQTFFKSRR
jgi:tRNA(adenine34) deaminase